jgi:Hemerythrin HHE cation binding domain
MNAPSDTTMFAPDLDALRRRRAELFESMAGLRQALAAPASGRVAVWQGRAAIALADLSADVHTHLAITEGPAGLHHDVLEMAPRLSHAVGRLTAEHAVFVDLLEGMRAWVPAGPVDAVRALGADLLDRLDRHRRREADLVFEAYETDIGGET